MGCEVLTDDQLVDRARSGEEAAFTELVERYQDRIFNLILRKVGRRREEALDLTQEVFLKVYRALPRFEGRSAFYTWLFRIALNTTFTARKKLARRDQHRAFSLQDGPVGLESGGFEPPDTTYEPSIHVLQAEREERVQRAIDELRKDYRDVILLKDIEGFRYHEIAEMLEVPAGSVKSRVHRARQALKEILARTQL